MYLLPGDRNPTLEEQALGRIHRIGQDKEVTTIRFCIRDSFEEVMSIFPVFSHFLFEMRHEPKEGTQLTK